MSSRSSVQAMNFWPKPMVYFPFGAPSKSSSSSCEMHCAGGGGKKSVYERASRSHCRCH